MSHCHTLIQNLRQNGYRITPQREMIIESLAHQPGHQTAEQVFDQVKTRTRSVNIATIYRTLDLLVSQGLATRTSLCEGEVVYATRQHGPHIHLVCRQCGCLINADSGLMVGVSDQLQALYGFDADLQHISITGLCTACQHNSPQGG